jgi:dGTPase
VPKRLPHNVVRGWLEAGERQRLSPHAAQSADARRDVPEEESGARTRFQRDRDRILHTKSFRRLKLNEDLAEAIGLGHDLGHAPFGHAGETALSHALGHAFRHNEQSRRIVEVLENDGAGLNLTREVREGIALHSKTRKNIQARAWGTASTLEGQIIKIADSVAYINHDIDDAIRAGILDEAELPREAVDMLGASHAERINTMVCDLIDHNWWATGEVEPPVERAISMSSAVLEVTNLLREFMFQRVYLTSPAKDEDGRVRFIIGHLFQYFMQHPAEVPDQLRAIAAKRGDDHECAVVDHIAGMTDRYALKVFNALYVPRTWSG